MAIIDDKKILEHILEIHKNISFEKFYQLQKENILTDLTIDLIDDKNKITINVHRVLLYIAAPYFEKLFSLFKEKNSDKISIIVPNAYVAYDIVMAFYQQKTNIGNLPIWKHALESVKCLDFFGFDIPFLSKMEIPSEGFELLLDAVEIIGYSEDTIKMIIENLPDEYDLSKFPKELLQEMLSITNSYYIISAGIDKNIKIWNMNGKLIENIPGPSSVYQVMTTNNNKQFVSVDRYDNIYIREYDKGKIINVKYINHNSLNIDCTRRSTMHLLNDNEIIIANRKKVQIINMFSEKIIAMRDNCAPDIIVSVMATPKKIIIGCVNGTINILEPTTLATSYTFDAAELFEAKISDTTTDRKNRYKGHCHKVNCFDYDDMNNLLVSGSSDNSVKIWCLSNLKIVETLYGHTSSVYSICFSPDKKKIISGSIDNTVKIWDTISRNLINTLIGHHDWVNSICFLPDNKIISGADDGVILVWNSENGEILDQLSKHTDTVQTVCYLPIYQKDLRDRIYEQLKN